jgi:hypothetical protein
MNGPIWRGGKFTTATTCFPTSASGGGAASTDLVSEIDGELDRGLARFGEGLGGDNGADADIDFQEIVEGNRAIRCGIRH